MRNLIILLLGCVAAVVVGGVKQEDFKQCGQSSFCRRLRGIASRQAASPETFRSPYSLGEPTNTPGTASDEASWTWPLSSNLYPEISFQLRVDVLDQGEGVVRVRVDEVGSKTPFKRYDETAKWVLLHESPRLASSASAKLTSASGKSSIAYGPPSSKLSLEIEHSPFKVTQLRDGQAEIVLNERSLFHMEHFRIKDVEKIEEAVGEGEQMVLKGGEMDRSWFEETDRDMFEEHWKKWKDSKPKALSIDLTFPGVEHIYGLPEHASPLSLPDTIGPNAHYPEPYRLFNVDIFEYLADSPMALYGAIPLLHAHSASHSVGVLNLVASDTWVDVLHTDNFVHTHWMSESGILDLLFLPGPKPEDLFEQYALLTGPTALPPQWSTAYHQCRWNYIDEEDVLEVDRRFDEVDIPLDVTWLDIEYAEEHRYFDWDTKHFPDPVRMLNKVADKGRKMVAIVDPHIKKTDSFRIFTDARDLDILMKKADGSNFEGWCWTGSSVWVDFFNPKSWEWWTRMFDFKTWKQSSPALFIWNDMNEPSVFDGPEISVPRDTIHHGGWENRDLHNLNGMMFHNQTSNALIAREEPAKRPFVLSRSFFAGSQRYGAIWTGDNIGDWEHLAGQTAMILSNNIAGMSFCGADVGGFFGNPSPELLVRWYQAGAFSPFFRAHAHIDTKRREPYLYDEPIRGYIRDIIRLRYQMLPVWYNAFHDASLGGAPIVRPQYAMFPEDERGFGIDDQFYLGNEGILMKPVTVEGATTTPVYLSDDQPYYDYFSHHVYPATGSRIINIDTPLDKFPLLLRGGSILPTRQRVRRSSPLMWQDPFTLVVALSKEGEAEGQVYLDDGVGYGYERGEYIWRGLRFSPAEAGEGGQGKSTSKGKGRGKGKDKGKGKGQKVGRGVLASFNKLLEEGVGVAEQNAWAQAIAHVRVEKIVILGVGEKPKGVMLRGGEELEWTYEQGVGAGGKEEGKGGRVVIKSPGVRVVEGWEIEVV